ncbi:MAG: tyrosine-protein phosphatase [Lachnospiraceae bacterium]|nr:tyrosine-protein phosphatase [Lachnospiraceae bacterium]
MNRWIDIPGLKNVRQLGGLTGVGGRKIKQDLLIRAQNLSRIEDSGISLLRQYDVKLIADLRMSFERDREPDRMIPGAEYVRYPIFDEVMLGDVMSNLGSKSPGGGGDLLAAAISMAEDKEMQNYMEIMYTSTVQSPYSMKMYSAFLKDILKREGGCVLWHCTAGKDRAGLAAVFILSILGVSRQDILDDYMLTNVAYSDMTGALLMKADELGADQRVKDTLMAMSGVCEKYMIEALDLIDEEYGGMDKYISDRLLITEEEKELFRKYYLI